MVASSSASSPPTGLGSGHGPLTRTAVGHAENSPFVRTTQGPGVRIKLDKAPPYELDGGDRKKVRKLRVDIEPGAVEICVPVPSPA